METSNVLQKQKSMQWSDLTGEELLIVQEVRDRMLLEMVINVGWPVPKSRKTQCMVWSLIVTHSYLYHHGLNTGLHLFHFVLNWTSLEHYLSVG